MKARLLVLTLVLALVPSIDTSAQSCDPPTGYTHFCNSYCGYEVRPECLSYINPDFCPTCYCIQTIAQPTSCYDTMDEECCGGSSLF